MKTLRTISLSHTISGALGALVTLGLAACLSSQRAGRLDRGESLSLVDAEGNRRISLGRIHARGDAYGIVLYAPGGERKAFDVVSTRSGTEAMFYEEDEKLGMWLQSSTQGSSIDLFEAGRHSARFGVESAEGGQLMLYRTRTTMWDGEPGYSVEQTAKLPN